MAVVLQCVTFLGAITSKILFSYFSSKTYIVGTQTTVSMGSSFEHPKQTFKLQSTLDTSNFKGLGKICQVISSSR